MMFIKKCIYILVVILFLDQGDVLCQRPYRIGTTTASYLEIGIGSVGISLGDAFTASANDISAVYWNPSGLANMERSGALFVYQPWIAEINNFFAGFGIIVPQIGTIGLSISGMDYGSDNEVTTLDFQEGTGEHYIAYDYSISLSYARKLVDWFSFGANIKYLTSKIWHMEASAAALDLGVQVQTDLFAFGGKRGDGMKLGMSISNYGTRMQYDGIDLLFPEDPAPDEDGNYQNVQAKYQTRE